MNFALVAATAAAFNLVCSGTGTTQSGRMVRSGFPFQHVFRVNTRTARFCDGLCHSTKPIARVGPREVVFFDSRIRGERMFQWASRESGAFFSSLSYKGGRTMYMGSCVRRPFTGFPRRKF
jgi:hypothetical protein